LVSGMDLEIEQITAETGIILPGKSFYDTQI
jgi:hypothetical protein